MQKPSKSNSGYSLRSDIQNIQSSLQSFRGSFTSTWQLDCTPSHDKIAERISEKDFSVLKKPHSLENDALPSILPISLFENLRTPKNKAGKVDQNPAIERSEQNGIQRPAKSAEHLGTTENHFTLDDVLEPAAAPMVSVRVADFAPLMIDAVRSNRAWVKDFESDVLQIPADLYEILVAYRQLRIAS